METIGLVGLGKIGLPIARNLMASGYRVVGYRRGPMREFVAAGGVAAGTPADVGASADIVLTCLPSEDALDAVVGGPNGLVTTARPGQIVAELGSHSLARKERHVATLAAKGAIFIDGEVSGTPGMVVRREGVAYIAGDEAACRRLEPVVKGFIDRVMYFGAFGGASRAKLINNHLVAIHIAATAEVMALALKSGLPPDKVIEAVVGGSGQSRQFGIRAPWMAAGRYLPAEGTPEGLAHYFRLIHEFAGSLEMKTPILDTAIALYERVMAAGLGENDNAVLVEFAGRDNQDAGGGRGS